MWKISFNESLLGKSFTEFFETPKRSFNSNDWDEIAPNTKMSFIFITARSGSTYIDSMLNQMDDIGRSMELFNEHALEEFKTDNICFKKFLEDKVKNLKQNNVFGVQSDWGRFNSCLKAKLIDPAFLNSQSVKCYILFRRNIVLQAISLIQAIDTGLWHVYDKSQKANSTNFDISKNISDSRLFKHINILLKREHAIFNFLSNQKIEPVIFFYEDLISEPYTVIEKLYRDVGVRFDTNKFNNCLNESSLTKKIKRENTPEVYLKFIKKYPIVSELINIRTQNYNKLIADNLIPNMVKIFELYESNPVNDDFFGLLN